ncbi:MAG: 1-deoxy-D-xylulose-5-phosphate synthase [Bacteroidales bacterium]|jgi:1-deoxy-D-xylulose-5-phosphate synthase|nr:1-deoxy-D-xylulose-5-phosphate synthase [Bacteroidales bacterium]
MKLLDAIQIPDDVRKLSIEQLAQLCKELREFIIDESSRNPGHFGASLGTVELTVALHYALNTPHDRIVWDVGHQAYAHKIITGRKEQFHSNRTFGGISGFPNPAESEYDSFIAGHSSTSISAALGMAIAAQQQGVERHIVAVIGDGSMTGGMAFEALNHAGFANANILVILNDNNMAIDAGVGALNQYLLDISTSRMYNTLKNTTWNFLERVSNFGVNIKKMAQKTGNAFKSMLLKESNLFEAFNFRYFGPVDGHNVFQLVRTIQDLQQIPGPKLLHIKTQKGKGFKPAEEKQTEWHAPRKFNKHTGEMISAPDARLTPPKYQKVFGETLLELAALDERVVGVTPAMASGCSMNILMNAMPHRAFDVGIAEQHAVTFAAGMAKDGLLPFCNIYSSFMQRAYDQVIHDVALQQLPVIFCLDRAGLVGADGATHHGMFDIAFMRAIPHLIVASPLHEIELRNLLYTAYKAEKPFVIRYPRGGGQFVDWKLPMEELEIGKGMCIREGNDIAILAFGPLGYRAHTVAETVAKTHNISVAVYNMRFVKPLDTELLNNIFAKFSAIITIEDGVKTGGFGSAIEEYAQQQRAQVAITVCGLPDEFIPHGTQNELHALCGLNEEGITQTILQNAKK